MMRRAAVALCSASVAVKLAAGILILCSFVASEEAGNGVCLEGTSNGCKQIEQERTPLLFPGCIDSQPLDRNLVQLRKRVPIIKEVMDEACKYTQSATPRIPSGRRGACAAADASLFNAETRLREALAEEKQFARYYARQWNAFVNWLQGLTRMTEVYETSVFSALAKEALFWRYARTATYAQNYLRVPIYFNEAVHRWVESGRREDARRLYAEAMASPLLGKAQYPWHTLFEDGGKHSYNFFHLDGLRQLPVPIPLDALENRLPPTLIDDVKRNIATIRAEAKRVAEMYNGDAYPGIVMHDRWQKLDLYTISQGWSAELCERMPTTCRLLKGKLFSETAVGHRWSRDWRGHTAGTDEVVILFRISPGGWVPLHCGQPQRVNVHFCLFNCEGANITVNGTTLDYHDGGVFAFEDRMWHELYNNAPSANAKASPPPLGGARINLVVGIWHPDYDPERADFPLFKYGLNEDAPVQPWMGRRVSTAPSLVANEGDDNARGERESPNCALLAAIGQCQRPDPNAKDRDKYVENEQMKADCPVSCTVGPRDNDSKCKAWAREGRCIATAEAHQMHLRCPLSCVAQRGARLDQACGFFGMSTMRYLPALWRLTVSNPRLDHVLTGACDAAAWGTEHLEKAAGPLRDAETVLNELLEDSEVMAANSDGWQQFVGWANAVMKQSGFQQIASLGRRVVQRSNHQRKSSTL